MSVAKKVAAPGDHVQLVTREDRALGRRRGRQVAEYGVLAEPPARDLVALVELAAQLCDVPIAAISLITEHEHHNVATIGFEPFVCAREDSLCHRVFHETDPVVVPDMSLDPRFSDHPLVNGDLSEVRFYANSRLVTSTGVAIGTICVADLVPRSLTPEQRGALTVLADRVVDVLDLRMRTRQLESSLAELTTTRDELRRSNEQLAAFAGQVSHDLRTPLTGISMCAQMLAEHPAVQADEDAAWMADRAVSSVGRMATMLEELLAYARVGGGVGYNDVDLALVAIEVLHDLDASLSKARAEVAVGELPVVRGDGAQLRAVLQNLVDNAAKFVRPGVVPRITLTSRRLGDCWRIEVADNGVGVAPERRVDVFGLLDRGGNDSVEGSGIGLATCHRVMEAHGGRIGLEDSPSGGTLVWFDVPDQPPE